jgi:hypothetical protein
MCRHGKLIALVADLFVIAYRYHIQIQRRPRQDVRMNGWMFDDLYDTDHVLSNPNLNLRKLGSAWGKLSMNLTEQSAVTIRRFFLV